MNYHAKTEPTTTENPNGLTIAVSCLETLDATDPRPFACPYPECAMRFKRKYTLKDHVTCHTGERAFVCPVPVCRKTFTTSGNLARHRRLHAWLSEPLTCLVDGCSCTFTNEEKLERHMLTHFGDSDEFRCEIGTCGRVFTTKGNLRRHIKQNHSDCGKEPHVKAARSYPYEPLGVMEYSRYEADVLAANDQDLDDELLRLFEFANQF